MTREQARLAYPGWLRALAGGAGDDARVAAGEALLGYASQVARSRLQNAVPGMPAAELAATVRDFSWALARHEAIHGEKLPDRFEGFEALLAAILHECWLRRGGADHDDHAQIPDPRA
ncbi:MAG: hypothetical protein FJZ01_01960 [Candidatus Sericytochromatia bacterium]|nr:hypothetical protein [Candidatus Tanganyikabacteria bacterium]